MSREIIGANRIDVDSVDVFPNHYIVIILDSTDVLLTKEQAKVLYNLLDSQINTETRAEVEAELHKWKKKYDTLDQDIFADSPFAEDERGKLFCEFDE